MGEWLSEKQYLYIISREYVAVGIIISIVLPMFYKEFLYGYKIFWKAIALTKLGMLLVVLVSIILFLAHEKQPGLPNNISVCLQCPIRRAVTIL